MSDEPERPVLRVVRGHPDEHEVAALATALAGLSASSAEPAANPTPRPLSMWNDRARMLGQMPRPGPGAWRASAWPR